MPYALPRDPEQQQVYEAQLQKAYDPARPRLPAVPAPRHRDLIADLEALAQLRDAGHLTEREFAAAKARLFAAQEHTA